MTLCEAVGCVSVYEKPLRCFYCVHSAVRLWFESCCFAFVCSVRFYSFCLKQNFALLFYWQKYECQFVCLSYVNLISGLLALSMVNHWNTKLIWIQSSNDITVYLRHIILLKSNINNLFISLCIDSDDHIRAFTTHWSALSTIDCWSAVNSSLVNTNQSN